MQTAHAVRSAATIAACCLATSGATGQTLHNADLAIRAGSDSHIEFGLPAQSGGVDWGVRTARARLDLAPFANLTDDPGFDSASGSFPPGTAIGFDLLGPLRLWDGEDFDGTDPDYAMSVTKGDAVVSTAQGRVPGFTFGSADAGGRFHHHVRYFLDPFEFTAVTGLWLLELELWSTNAAALPSEPFFIVFASGQDALDQQDDAVAWVEQNLLGGACAAADLVEPLGVLDLGDITAFIGAFTASDPLADLAEPLGVYDLSDLVAFIESFTTGCP